MADPITPDPDVSKRTAEQIEKLTEHNRELKQQLEETKKKNVLQSLTPDPSPQTPPSPPKADEYSNLSQGDVDKIFQEMIDKEGYVDGDKMKQVLRDSNNRAIQAEERNKKMSKELEETKEEVKKVVRTQQDFEESKIIQSVHGKYPQLDPNGEEFDEDFFDLVKNDMIGQMAVGKQDLMEAADKWYSKHYQGVDMNKKDQDAANAKRDAKKTINAATPRTSSMLKGHWTSQEEAGLLKAAQQGKKGSVAELLRRREKAE